MLKFETNLELKFNLVGISTRVCKILMKMTKIVTSLNMTLVDINSFFIHLLTIGRDLLLKGEMKIILMEKDPYLFSLPEVNGHFLKQKLISPSLCNNKLPPSAYNLCVVRILPQALTTHWSSIGEAGCPFFRPKFRFPFGILEELSLWSRLLLRSEFRPLKSKISSTTSTFNLSGRKNRRCQKPSRIPVEKAVGFSFYVLARTVQNVSVHIIVVEK